MVSQKIVSFFTWGGKQAAHSKSVPSFRTVLDKLRLVPKKKPYIPPKVNVLTSKVEPLGNQAQRHVALNARLNNGETVGRCSFAPYRIQENTIINYTEYPKSWINRKTGVPKDSLFVDYIETTNPQKHLGHGREIMKRLFIESVNSGCEGRISLETAWGSQGFYEKLGFGVGEEAVQRAQRQLKRLLARERTLDMHGFAHEQKFTTPEEIQNKIKKLKNMLDTRIPCTEECEGSMLFFTPTSENIAKLFSK